MYTGILPAKYKVKISVLSDKGTQFSSIVNILIWNLSFKLT